MKKDIDFIARADSYIRGEMSPMEQREFERYCQENPEEAARYEEHHLFVKKLAEYQRRIEFRAQLEHVESRLNLKELQGKPKTGKVLRFWRNHGITTLVAASVALMIVFSTLWMSGFYSNVKDNTSKYSALKRDMNRIQNNVNAQNRVINDISSNVQKSAPSSFGGTGFALTSNGYIATNYHVISGADSVYVQNEDGVSYKTNVIYIDPTYDIALLEIIDPAFTELEPLPYTFKTEESDLGQNIFTIGFPREEPVYGRGYLSSNTGYGGDTVAYQVSIPVNPGNSGGPVLDDAGNVIGVINGKQKEADGAAFAVKTEYLLKSLENVSRDSLDKKLSFNKTNLLKGLPRTSQIQKLKSYIYMVKVY